MGAAQGVNENIIESPVSYIPPEIEKEQSLSWAAQWQQLKRTFTTREGLIGDYVSLS